MITPPLATVRKCNVGCALGVFLQQPRGTPCVLIVDADSTLHSAAHAILQRAGVDVDYVTDLSAAAARLFERTYAAVLIDAASTACDGQALTAFVQPLARRQPPGDPSPVLQMIVVADSYPVMAFDPSLASLVIRKPYDIQMVIGVLLACGTDRESQRA